MTSAFTARSNWNIFYTDCWACNAPTMRVEEIQMDERLVIVSEHCQSEHCDHYDTYEINLED